MFQSHRIVRHLRNAQTFFPQIRSLKFRAYNFGTRHFGWRVPEEFVLLRKLGRIDLVLDIGGNWGQSIYALKYSADPSRIISFEPNSDLASALSKRFHNDPAVHIINCALGDSEGSFDLFTPQYRNYVYDGLSSLKESEARGWLNAQRMSAFNPEKLVCKKQTVDVRRLDEFGYAPNVVKIDVQGAEEMVVRGGSDMFQRHRPVTIVEAPSDSLIALMKDFGLDAYGCCNGRLTNKYTGRTDVIFATEDQARAMTA